MIKRIYEEYFKLRFEDKISSYAQMADDESNARQKYEKNGGIAQYYADIITEKLNHTVTLKDIKKAKEYWAEYYLIYKQYFSKDRADLFKYDNTDTLMNWWKLQDSQCQYCGVSQPELRHIFKEGKGILPLNDKTKRSRGTLEIEKKDPSQPYIMENVILACPLCNNAKSNLLDEKSWRELFVDPMREYYKKLLGKELKNPKP